MSPSEKPKSFKGNITSIDLAFRPITYWEGNSLEQALLGNIQGEARRGILSEVLESEGPASIPEGLLEPVLTPEMRQALGRTHPTFMGGEYLPPYLPGEVEILRICLGSTTSDVISLRACMGSAHDIRYRVVDEYGTDYTLPITTSQSPLSMQELVDQLEGSSNATGTEVGLVIGPLKFNLEGDGGGTPSEFRDFIKVRSDFYPEIGDYCSLVCAAYLDELEEKLEGENHGDD